MYKGKLIYLEGGEGTGKSTQNRLICDYLRQNARRVLMTREPGGTAMGRNFRGMLLDPTYAKISPLAELFLYETDRVVHMDEVVIPALRRGEIVVSDRSELATICYQHFGRGLDKDMVLALNKYATRGVKPDLALIFLIDPEIGLRRARSRNEETANNAESKFDDLDNAFHERVLYGMRQLPLIHPDYNIQNIDAGKSIEDVFEQIKPHLDDLLRN